MFWFSYKHLHKNHRSLKKTCMFLSGKYSSPGNVLCLHAIKSFFSAHIKTQLFYCLSIFGFFPNLSVIIYLLHTYGKASGLKKEKASPYAL